MPKKVVCRELGPPESLQLETFASAPLAPGEVRVAVHAAGINFPDVLMAAGEYQLKPPLPFTPGHGSRRRRDRGQRRRWRSGRRPGDRQDAARRLRR